MMRKSERACIFLFIPFSSPLNPLLESMNKRGIREQVSKGMDLKGSRKRD
jgi:hypothetical protein